MNKLNTAFINGGPTGRIGLNLLYALAGMYLDPIPKGRVVGISMRQDLCKDINVLAERYEHDAVHGRIPFFDEVWAEGPTVVEKRWSNCVGSLRLRNIPHRIELHIPIFIDTNLRNLPLEELGVDVVLEGTGAFLTAEKAQVFLDAGAKKVIMCAPSKDDTPQIIYSINGGLDDGLNFVSLASCTTNCEAPIIEAIRRKFGMPNYIKLDTVHAVTNSQPALGGNASKAPNSLASFNNIVPTSTGATKSLAKIFGDLIGEESITGTADRVPVDDGSVANLTLVYNHLVDNLTKENVIDALCNSGLPKESLRVTDRTLFYSAYAKGDICTSIVSSRYLDVINGQIIFIKSLYDNERAYAHSALSSAFTCPLSQD